MPPRILHHIELPELRQASALLQNLRRECAALLVSERSPLPPKYPTHPGEAATPEVRLAWLQELGKIERQWYGSIAERVVRGFRFTGTSWTPKLPELAVGVVKWAEAVLVELAAADEVVQELEDAATRQTRLVERLQTQVLGLERANAAAVEERDTLKQQVSALQQALTVSRATEEAWRASAKASGDAATAATTSLQILQAALRIPGSPPQADDATMTRTSR